MPLPLLHDCAPLSRSSLPPLTCVTVPPILSAGSPCPARLCVLSCAPESCVLYACPLCPHLEPPAHVSSPLPQSGAPYTVHRQRAEATASTGRSEATAGTGRSEATAGTGRSEATAGTGRGLRLLLAQAGQRLLLAPAKAVTSIIACAWDAPHQAIASTPVYRRCRTCYVILEAFASTPVLWNFCMHTSGAEDAGTPEVQRIQARQRPSQLPSVAGTAGIWRYLQTRTHARARLLAITHRTQTRTSSGSGTTPGAARSAYLLRGDLPTSANAMSRYSACTHSNADRMHRPSESSL